MIQKNIVNACAKETLKVTIEDLNGDYFGILVDESKDISHKEQMALVLSYVDKNGEVVERFIDFVHLNDRFDVASSDLLLGMGNLNPVNSFSNFDKDKIMILAKCYPNKFDDGKLQDLSYQLDTFIIHMRRRNSKFSNLQGIRYLAKALVEANLVETYSLVYLIVKLALILPVATATVERAFSSMKNIKNESRKIDPKKKERVQEALNYYYSIESDVAVFVSFSINLMVTAVLAKGFYGTTQADRQMQGNIFKKGVAFILDGEITEKQEDQCDSCQAETMNYQADVKAEETFCVKKMKFQLRMRNVQLLTMVMQLQISSARLVKTIQAIKLKMKLKTSLVPKQIQQLRKLNQIKDATRFKDKKTHAKYEPSDELSESYRKLRGIARRRDTKEPEESRQFNPRPPNFLPLEPEPDAEKVDLKHQMMDDRKNAEDWMLDFALRRVEDKLAPARKRKVALLVEAFETVIPTSKWEPHLRRSAAGFAHPRPIQACN
ncbi:hypothetical protein FXO37_34026 [Capsicum annuum]|nr:hypothetical protein FXO37_34026 [Capsicum annuum]